MPFIWIHNVYVSYSYKQEYMKLSRLKFVSFDLHYLVTRVTWIMASVPSRNTETGLNPDAAVVFAAGSCA